MTPIVASAATRLSLVMGRVNFALTSVPPVNESPSRSGAPVRTKLKIIIAIPSAIMAYEIAETVRNQPTTFQFRRRKNIYAPACAGAGVTMSGAAPHAALLVTKSLSTTVSTRKRVTTTAVNSDSTVPQNSV